ncbi:CCHC-type domain-containing protein [Abeliophyllum distichum]|uniref:CCHC-type domain-containing protein n=1 Tax=Abeliophyllum distichum TaxID=126358 RepID=A0ABD1UQD1_9LAMI
MAKAESNRRSVAASDVGSDPDPFFENDNEDDCLGIDSRNNPLRNSKVLISLPNIPKTYYSEEEDDLTRHGSESPTLSDMRSQRDQLNVISSTIDRKREFKKSKDPQIRSFRKNLKRLLSKEEMDRFWEEFYSYPKYISFFEWAYLKTFKQKPTINTFQDKSKIWKTTSENTFQSVHPPLEKIVIPKGDVKVIAFPLKQISDKRESENPTIKDIKNIKQQNNYTNILLHSVATQLNQIEQPTQNELVKQNIAKEKEKTYEKNNNTSKTLFKPSGNKVHFGSGSSDVLYEIVKQLRDKDSTSKINVIDSIGEIQEQFEELKINKLKAKSFANHTLPHFYSRPTFPDMLQEEPTPHHKTFSGLECLLGKGNTDKEAAINIMNGFSAQLKNWWFNYLSSDEYERITNVVKKEGDIHIDPSKQDAVCTLLSTIIKYFIGEPSSFMEKSSELFMNLTCPKLQDFRWYKDIRPCFMTTANLPFGKKGLLQIIGFINKEGLSLCNDLKLKAKLKSDRMEELKELGCFSEQYRYERIHPPPSRSHKFSQKQKYHKKKKYYNKNFVPEYYKKQRTPTKFHKYNKYKRKRSDKDKSSKYPHVRVPLNTTCWKCKKKGHYANKCPLRRKINNLQIDDDIKSQLLNLIESESSSSEDIIYNLQDDSDYSEISSSSKSSSSIKICNCKDNCTCETNSINVLTSEKELIQEIISQIQDPDLKQKFQQILDHIPETKPPPRTYNVNDVFDRFKKSNKSSSSQDLRREVNQMKKQISDLVKELSQLKFEVFIIKTYSPSKGKEKIHSLSNSENFIFLFFQ